MTLINKPEIIATPKAGPIDQPLQLAVRGLPPRAHTTLRAQMVDVRGATWRSHASCTADDNGAIDLATLAQDLIAALALDANVPSRTFDNSSLEPLTVEFGAEVDGRMLAVTTARRHYGADDVRMRLVGDDGFSALFFQPRDETERPGVVVLGGSSGGLLFASQTAALLASRGFASLALAYFGLEGLPPHLVEIPIEYCERAIDWLSCQPNVAADRIAVLGRSRGAELALLLGTRIPLIRSVVAYGPSGVVWSGLRGNAPARASAWSEAGRPLPYCSLTAPNLGAMTSRVFATEPIALTPLFDAALDGVVPEDAVIPVERINGPVLLVSGRDDLMWPSARMGDAILRRLQERRHPFPSRHLVYPGAGHLLRTPGVPTSVLQNMFAFGGEPAAQAAANDMAWTATLAFLSESLAPSARVDALAATGGQR